MILLFLKPNQDSPAVSQQRWPTAASWLFAPCMREWTVQGNTVGGSIQIMEGASVRFDYAADWLVEYAGAKVRVHFDPAAPKAEATIVLAQNVRDCRSGTVLGTAVQINKTAQYARRQRTWLRKEADVTFYPDVDAVPLAALVARYLAARDEAALHFDRARRRNSLIRAG